MSAGGYRVGSGRWVVVDALLNVRVGGSMRARCSDRWVVVHRTGGLVSGRGEKALARDHAAGCTPHRPGDSPPPLSRTAVERTRHT